MKSCNHILTPIEEISKLGKDKSNELVDPTTFRRMVKSLWYFTRTRPDIVFAFGFVTIFMESPTNLTYKQQSISYDTLKICKMMAFFIHMVIRLSLLDTHILIVLELGGCPSCADPTW